MRCRSWSCPNCAPRRRKQLIAQALQGEPTRFVTLTVNPGWYDSPEERGLKLSRAWRDFVRDYRKRHPARELQYLAVVELTKRGEPHLHIICRSDWINQKDLSDWMRKALGAPIVDVRLVKGVRDVAQYVAKYISKRPIRLGTLKRYWRSALYLDPEIQRRKKLAKLGRSVWIIDLDIETFKRCLKANGHVIYQPRPDDCEWTMYYWENRPPGLSGDIRRVR